MLKGLRIGHTYNISFEHSGKILSLCLGTSKSIMYMERNDSNDTQSWLWMYPGVFVCTVDPSLCIVNFDDGSFGMGNYVCNQNNVFLIEEKQIINEMTNKKLAKKGEEQPVLYLNNESNLFFEFSDTVQYTGVFYPEGLFSILSDTIKGTFCVGVLNECCLYPIECSSNELFFYDPIEQGDIRYLMKCDKHLPKNDELINASWIMKNKTVVNIKNNLYLSTQTASMHSIVMSQARNQYYYQAFYFRNERVLPDVRFDFNHNFALCLYVSGQLFAVEVLPGMKLILSEFSPFNVYQRFRYIEEGLIVMNSNPSICISIENDSHVVGSQIVMSKIIKDNPCSWEFKSGRIIDMNSGLGIRLCSQPGTEFDLGKISTCAQFSILFAPFMMLEEPIFIKDVPFIEKKPVVEEVD